MSSSNDGMIDQMLERAAQRLLDGGLVAFPTETVYGLGADAENVAAVARIYAAKGRPANHPVIVHLPPDGDIEHWARLVPIEARRLIDAFWPGPLTLILPRADHIPDAVSGGQNSIGLRCPSHPVAQALLRRFAELKGGQGGVAAPSANLFGQVSPTQAEHVRAEFSGLGEDELLILEGGASEVGIESTILDLSRLGQGVGPVLLRPGHVTAAQIARVLGVDESVLVLAGEPLSSGDPGADLLSHGTPVKDLSTTLPTPRVSGSLKAHYAPRTPLWVVPGDALVRCLEGVFDERVACVTFDRPDNAVSTLLKNVEWHIVQDDPVVYARELYALLRRLDQGGYARLVFEQPPRSEPWRAVSDRLGRAAAAFGG